MLTPTMAFAPSLDLSGVRSRSISAWSTSRWSSASWPRSSGWISSMTPWTARVTPLPPYSEPPSLSSTASNAPVEAPLGTPARPTVPSSSATSTSRVGLPRESRICLAWIASMEATAGSLPVARVASASLEWAERKLAQCEPNRAEALRTPATPLCRTALTRRPRPARRSTPAGSGAGDTDGDAERPVSVRGRADDGLVRRVPIRKGGEALMRVDVVHQHDPADGHGRGRLLHLEHRVLGGVQTVVDEHLHMADLAHQRRKPVAARAFQVRPARAALIGDGDAGFRVQAMIEGKRQVDAPQVAEVVPAQCLEHDPARHAVRDSRLDRYLGPVVQRHAPQGAAQRTVGIRVPGVGLTPEAPSPGRE